MGVRHGVERKQTADTGASPDADAVRALPRVNLAALFLPPVWGPAHGLWVSIAFYPLWIVADTCFVNAFAERTPLAVAAAALVFVILTALTAGFSVVSQRYAFARARAMGLAPDAYLRRQRIWAAVCIPLGLAMIAAATYYNVFLNSRSAIF